MKLELKEEEIEPFLLLLNTGLSVNNLASRSIEERKKNMSLVLQLYSQLERTTNEIFEHIGELAEEKEREYRKRTLSDTLTEVLSPRFADKKGNNGALQDFFSSLFTLLNI